MSRGIEGNALMERSGGSWSKHHAQALKDEKACWNEASRTLSDLDPGFIIPLGTFPILDKHLHCFGCTGQWDNHDSGAYCRYCQDPDVCTGPRAERERCHG
jgi:hypothetical protein